MTEAASSYVNYLWRIFATGFCFSVFGLGSLLLVLTLLPAAQLSPGNSQRRNNRARRVIHHAMRGFIGLMDLMGCNSVRVKGRAALRNSSGQLVIANHPSLIDVVILIACIPNCCCIVKQSLWRNPFIGGVVRMSGYISNSDPEALMEQCRETLQSGCSILVFPEGTRTVDGSALKFQRGAANIALRCAVDIMPITISPNPPTLRKGEPWHHVPARRAIFKVEVLEPIVTSEIIGNLTETSLATRTLNRYLQAYYQDLVLAA